MKVTKFCTRLVVIGWRFQRGCMGLRLCSGRDWWYTFLSFCYKKNNTRLEKYKPEIVSKKKKIH